MFLPASFEQKYGRTEPRFISSTGVRELKSRRGKETLKREEDAFGQLLLACYEENEAVEIIERDDGLISAYDPRVYFSDHKHWPVFEREAMRFVKGRVLDIGCGAGRHALYLQRKGFDVLGIDKSLLAIEICKLRGLRKAKVMSVEDAWFRRDRFDTIIMMGNNFGLLGGFRKARRLLKRFHRMTSKDAVIVAETRDPYKTEKRVHLEYHRLNRRRRRMAGQVRIRIRFEKCATGWFDYLFVSKDEMKEILRGTGWKIRQFIDSKNSQYVAIIGK